MSDSDAALREAVATAMWQSEGGTGKFSHAPSAQIGRYLGLADAALAAAPVPPDGENPYRKLIALHPGKDFGPPSPPTSLPAINRAVTAWDEGFAAGRAATTPPLHGTGYCPQPCPECAAATPDPPDEPFSDAVIDKIASALMGDTLRVIDGLAPGAQPAYRQGVRDRVRAALDVALPIPAASPDERLREAATDT